MITVLPEKIKICYTQNYELELKKCKYIFKLMVGNNNK